MTYKPEFYRNGCAKYLARRCNTEFKTNPVRDESLWRWKNELILSITSTLDQLGFFANDYH